MNMAGNILKGIEHPWMIECAERYHRMGGEMIWYTLNGYAALY